VNDIVICEKYKYSMRRVAFAAKFEVITPQSPTETEKNNGKHIIVGLCAWGMKEGPAVFMPT
jgi:hypothetical protein